MNVLKISAVAMTLALSAFSANAADHSKDAGFSCSQCKSSKCKDGATEGFLKSCADCPGLEVVDCGTSFFDSANCQGASGDKLKKDARCQSAAKMMSKGMFQAHLYAKEGNPLAQISMALFGALDKQNLGEARDKGADKYGAGDDHAEHVAAHKDAEDAGSGRGDK